MIYFSVLLFISTVYAANNNCQFSQSNFAANWTMTNNGIDIHLTYNALRNNRFISIGFNDKADHYSQISFFQNDNGQVNVTTGSNDENGDYIYDSPSLATVHYARINGKVLDAFVTVPLTLGGADMTACQKWTFYDNVDDEDLEMGPTTNIGITVPNVCPSKCK